MTLIPWHFDLSLFTICAFFAALVACIAGLFYSHYRENWLQHVGMIAVGLASALKIQQIYHRGFVSPETALLAAGLACFAAGVAWKVWMAQRASDRPYRGPDRRRANG
jgi:hypothetical protein